MFSEEEKKILDRIRDDNSQLFNYVRPNKNANNINRKHACLLYARNESKQSKNQIKNTKINIRVLLVITYSAYSDKNTCFEMDKNIRILKEINVKIANWKTRTICLYNVFVLCTI